MKIRKVFSVIPRSLRALSSRIHEAIESWMEMAPYNVSIMARSYSNRTVFGFNSLNADPANNLLISQLDRQSEYRRQELLSWHFLAMSRIHFGTKSTATGLSWIRLGMFYLDNRNPGNAFRFIEKGLNMVELDRKDEPQFADSILFGARKDVAESYLRLNRYGEAEPLLEKLILTLKAFFGEPGKSLKARFERQKEIPAQMFEEFIRKRARVLTELSRFDDAIACLEELADLFEVMEPRNHLKEASVYDKLAQVYILTEDRENHELYRKIAASLEFLAIMEKSCGEDSRMLKQELEKLIDLYRKAGRIHLLAPLNHRIAIIELAWKVKGIDYPGIEADLDQLAGYYEKRAQGGDGVVAFRLRKRIERLKEKLSG